MTTIPKSSDPSLSPTVARTLIAGAVALLVVHGLGRFVYTPLLPWLIEDDVVTLSQGASLATWNYVGYLLGALLAVRWHRPGQIQRVLPWALIGNAAITLAQGLTEDVGALTALRLANGITNGLVFVQIPALILEWLTAREAARQSGLVYLGVGAGLLLSSGIVALSAPYLEGANLWWPAALVALPLAWWSSRFLTSLTVAAPPPPQEQHSSGALLDRASVPLFLAYAGAGLGYILPMTFLPVVASQALGSESVWREFSWLVVALAALPSTWLWNRLGSLLGDKLALLMNYAIQAAGVAAPLFLPSAVGIALCAVLVGSTFIGTVLLTQRLARAIHPHQGPRLSAALIALYGLAQLTGPWITEWWLGQGGTLLGSFWWGLGALVWGFLFSLWVPGRR
jgi:predicted MFS family arabinose efflux permease